MIARSIPLKSKFQTGKVMYALVRRTANDLQKIKIDGMPIAKMPLCDFYDFVKYIPYRQDPKPREIIARPAHLIAFRNAGLDCKKKAILLGSWAAVNRIPFRFVATSRKPDRRVHHVLPQLKISGRYISTDATYPYNSINERKPTTNFIVLKG